MAAIAGLRATRGWLSRASLTNTSVSAMRRVDARCYTLRLQAAAAAAAALLQPGQPRRVAISVAPRCIHTRAPINTPQFTPLLNSRQQSLLAHWTAAVVPLHSTSLLPAAMTGAAAASSWCTLRTRQQSMSTASSPGTPPKADAAKNPPIHTDQPIAGQNAATPDAAAADAQLQRVWTVPNALSFARLVSSPVILVCFAGSQYHAAAGLFVFGAVSDLLDGMIARAFPSQRSMLGTALDPLADKFFMICSAAALAWVGSMPLPLATLVIARDVSLITGASYYRWKTTERPRTWTKLLDITQVATEFIPTRISKLNTAVQFITIFCAVLTFTPYSIVSATTLDWMWWTMAFTTFASGLSYVGNNNAVKLLKIPRRS